MESSEAPKRVIRELGFLELLDGRYELIPDRKTKGCWLLVNHDLELAALVYTESHPSGANLKEVDFRAGRDVYPSNAD